MITDQNSTVRPFSQGFTLIEILVSMAIFSIVMAGLVQIFVTSNRQQTTQEMLVTTTQDLRSAKMIISQEIREAGLNPTQSSDISFQTSGDDRYNTDANSIHFTRDFVKSQGGTWVDGYDGKTNGPNEDIRYYRTNDDCSPGAVGAVLAAGDNTLGCLRRDTGGGGQAMMPNVTNLQFIYYNENNVAIAPATLTTAQALKTIKTVEVILTGQVENTTMVDPLAQNQTLTFRVLARNL